MNETINPIAQQVVDNAQIPNSNGIQGSLPGETPSETKARLYRVMVDGQAYDVDEAELTRGYSHAKAAAKRMEEASMKRKEAEQVLQLMKDNPRFVMEKLGLNPRQFAEEIINNELSEALLTPEQRDIKKYKQQIEQYEQERRQAQKQYEQEEMNRQMNAQAELIQNQIIQTLDTAGLPKTDRTISRIIYYMQSALQNGYNVEPKDVIDLVKEDYKSDMKSLLGGLSEDQLEMFLESDLIRKINKSTVKKMQQNITPKKVNENREPRTAKEGKKFTSPKEFFNKSY